MKSTFIGGSLVIVLILSLSSVANGEIGKMSLCKLTKGNISKIFQSSAFMQQWNAACLVTLSNPKYTQCPDVEALVSGNIADSMCSTLASALSTGERTLTNISFAETSARPKQLQAFAWTPGALDTASLGPISADALACTPLPDSASPDGNVMLFSGELIYIAQSKELADSVDVRCVVGVKQKLPPLTIDLTACAYINVALRGDFGQTMCSTIASALSTKDSDMANLIVLKKKGMFELQSLEWQPAIPPPCVDEMSIDAAPTLTPTPDLRELSP